MDDKSESTRTSSESLFMKYVKISAIVILYWFVSITMVFLNKQILSGESFNLNAPFFVTWFQCIISLLITTIFSYVINETGSILTLFKSYKIKFPTSNSNIPPIYFRFSIVRQVFPLSFVFVAMISFNNLCLKNVGVSFYFIGRSLTTVFNVGLTFFILRKSTSLKAVLCCIVLVIGFFIGVDQENVIGTLSISGVIYGVLASFFVSLNSIFIAKALSFVENSIWLLTFYNNLIAVFLFIPLILMNGELATVYYSFHQNFSLLWMMLLISGLFGFMIGFVTSLQIKYTSPLTHNISGTAKACAQTVIATKIYSEPKTFNWWLSNIVILGASAAYTRVKQQEMKQIHQNTNKMNKRNKEDRELLLDGDKLKPEQV